MKVLTFGFYSVFIGFVALSLDACREDPTSHFRDAKMVIVSMDENSSISNDKFHRPQLCHSALISTTTTPKMYAELSTCSRINISSIDTKWFYNHSVGDTIYFEYIRRDRFFTIDDRKLSK